MAAVAPVSDMTPEACRAGRALLGWSLRDLAAAAGLSLGAVARFEIGRGGTMPGTIDRVRTAFAAEGVDLISEPDRTGAVLTYARRRS